MTTYLKTFIDAIKDRDFVILDTETTGLHQGEICEIAILQHNGEVLFNSRVKTHDPIPPDASAIHGITDLDVALCKIWPEVACDIERILKGQIVVVYNAIYDRRLMHQSAEMWEMQKTDWKTISTWLCAMTAYAEYFGDWNPYREDYKWQSLSAAARQCGVLPSSFHDALSDCETTRAVVRYMLNNPLSEGAE